MCLTVGIVSLRGLVICVIKKRSCNSLMPSEHTVYKGPLRPVEKERGACWSSLFVIFSYDSFIGISDVSKARMDSSSHGAPRIFLSRSAKWETDWDWITRRIPCLGLLQYERERESEGDLSLGKYKKGRQKVGKKVHIYPCWSASVLSPWECWCIIYASVKNPTTRRWW